MPEMPEPVKRINLCLEVAYTNGNKPAKDFNNVQALAWFLKDNPDIVKGVNYIPKKKI